MICWSRKAAGVRTTFLPCWPFCRSSSMGKLCCHCQRAFGNRIAPATKMPCQKRIDAKGRRSVTATASSSAAAAIRALYLPSAATPKAAPAANHHTGERASARPVNRIASGQSHIWVVSGPSMVPKARRTRCEGGAYDGEDGCEPAAAHVAGQHEHGVCHGGRQRRREHADGDERGAEDLRQGGEKRHERRLVDIAESRMPAANDEIELVAEEAVMRVAGKVEEESDGCQPHTVFRCSQGVIPPACESASMSRAP